MSIFPITAYKPLVTFRISRTTACPCPEEREGAYKVWVHPHHSPCLPMACSHASGEMRTAAAAAESLRSCLTLCDPIDGSPTGSAVPWDSPGKNTGVGCHFLLQCMNVKSESEVAQSCPTLSDPHGLQSTRLLHPWDFPGKSTGVGCHCLLRDAP